VGALLEEAHSIWLAVVSSTPYEANVSVAVLVSPEPYGLTTNDHHLQNCGHQDIWLFAGPGEGAPLNSADISHDILCEQGKKFMLLPEAPEVLKPVPPRGDL